MANRSLGEAVLRTRLDRSGLQAGLKTARSETEQTFTTLDRRLDATGRKLQQFGAGLTVGLTVPLAALGVAVTRAASDAEETRAKFQTVFRDIGGDAQAAADRLSDAFGQSDRAAQALLANTGDLLTGFGFQQKAALDLSQQVNELAIDLASFTNFQGGAEAASAALTSALLGEREAAKSLGIVITEDVVQSKIEELRLSGELVGATEQQAKAYATLLIAQEQSANAIGDFARTQDSFANQTRILNSNLEDLRVALGEGILPVVTPLVGRLADAAGALSDMDEGTRNTVIAFGGLAAAAGPLAIALGSVARGIVAIRTAALPLLGPAGIILGLGAAVATLATVMVQQGEKSIRTSEAAVKDLVSQYDRYRGALATATAAEREAAQERLQTMKDELQERLRVIQEIIEAEINRTQGFIDSALGRFLLPGFIEFEGGASQELFDQLGELRGTIANINADLDSLERGVDITPQVVPTPDVPTATTGDPTGLLGLQDGIDVPVRLGVTPDVTVTARGLPTTPAAAQPPSPSRPSDAVGFGTLSDQLAARDAILADTAEALNTLTLAIPDVTASGGQPVSLTAPSVSVDGDRVDLAVSPELSRAFPSPGEDRRASIQVGQARFGSVEQQIAYTEQLRAQYIARFGARDLGITPTASLGSTSRALPVPEPSLGGGPVTLPVPDPVVTGFEDAAQSVKDAAAEQRDAGLGFAKSVVDAGSQFVSAIGQFQAGNIGGGVAGLAGTAGSLFSSIGSLFGLGGAGPIGALIGAGGGLLAGFINLLSGGGDQGGDVQRESLDRSRGVPAVNINVSIDMDNTYNGGPDQPQVEQAFLRQARQVVEEILDRSGIYDYIQTARSTA